MNADRYARLTELFLTVRELPPAERAAGLKRACAGDESLEREVAALLSQVTETSIFAGRSHVGLGPEANSKWSEEQRHYLYERIRMLAVMVYAFFGVFLLRQIIISGAWAKMPHAAAIGLVAGVAAFTAVSFWLQFQRELSWSSLRVVEGVLLGAIVMVLGSWQYGWLVKGVSISTAPVPQLENLLEQVYWAVSPGGTTHFRVGSAHLSAVHAPQWAMVTSFYLLSIPNGWKRGTIVLLVLIAIPQFVTVAAAIHNAALRPHALGNVVVTMLLMVVFGTLALYVGIKWQALRKAVFDAKQIGQYQLLQLLGRGAMGEVHLAQHRLLRRPCAIKLIRSGRTQSHEWLARFEREVQAMARLTHPNTVEIYDFGRTDDDSFFYAMEYLPGLTLDAFIRLYGPTSPGRAVHLLRQVCGALAEAHALGLIHRDIKPSNIFICERGGMKDVVKLLDFGLVYQESSSEEAALSASVTNPSRHSRPMDETTATSLTLTRFGQLIGTPAYMAPEQVRGELPDARSDIYSLGGVACFLLTGKPPFPCDSLEAYCEAHLSESPPQLCEQHAGIPEDVSTIVTRCMAKERAERYQRIEDLVEALEATAVVTEWNQAKAALWWLSVAKPSMHPAQIALHEERDSQHH